MLAGAIGAAIAVGVMEALSVHTAIPLMVLPFATSIVLVMGTPDVEAAQPRALVGGHLVATFVGLVVVKLVGPSAWAAAFAVGLAIASMQLTRTFHPPAGINPLLVVINNLSWSFLLVPVAVGSALLALFAVGWNSAVRRQPWPKQWW